MKIKIHSTRDVAINGVKMLVYGESGAGKTRLNVTLPHPIILSAESGLLSLQDYDLDYIPIYTVNDLADAYRWATESKEADNYESISLDSISEIAEAILNAEKKDTKDPRQAYGSMQEQIADWVRAFRDVPGKHVYMSAKAEKSQTETGRILYSASLPGNKASQALPYFFDEVLALRVEKASSPDEEPTRWLLTRPDGSWNAKDRSGRLDMWEEPDLGAIIAKIMRSDDPPRAAHVAPAVKGAPKKKAAAAKGKLPRKYTTSKPSLDFEADEDESED